MASNSQTSKTFLLLLGFTLLLSTASAELDVEKDTFWLNGDNNDDLLNVSVTEDNFENLTVLLNDKEVGIADEPGLVTSEEFRDAYNWSEGFTGEKKLRLYTQEGEDFEEEQVKLDYFEIGDDVDEGSGFIGSRLGQDENTETLNFRIGAKESSFNKDDLDNFEILPERKADLNSDDSQGSIELVNRNGEVEVIASPQILEDLNEGQSMTLGFEVNGIRKEIDFRPELYSLRAEAVERPSNELEYSNIEDYSYRLNILENGNDVGSDQVSLYDDDFKLEIETLAEEEFSDDGEKWLQSREIEGEDGGDYLLELDNIPQLEPETYRFTIYLDAEDQPETEIDTIRVGNGLKLSGRVEDSSLNGIPTKFTLNREDTSIPITTTEGGNYYKEISSGEKAENYEVSMEFFQRQGLSSSPDAEIIAQDVDFKGGEGENLAGDSESIKFEYSTNPEISEDPINPISRMAVKFAYPVGSSGHSASMKFNPANVDYDRINVYECSRWNFLGTRCMGDWDQVEDVNIDPSDWTANFDIDEIYDATDSDGNDQNILMNAYIVGTSADLGLSNGVTVRGPDNGRIATGSEVTVEGRVVSENENFVEGADVEVSFYQGDEEVDRLETAETDIEGRFEATGEAPEEPGNYSVEITADELNYNRFEKEFDNSFETFVREGVAVRTDSPVDVALGGESETEITVQNTGQTAMKNIELEFEGLEADYYSASESGFSEIPAGEERIVDLAFSLPEDYCGDVCENYPQLDITATAENEDDETFESGANTLRTQITRTDTENTSEGDASTQDESSTTENDSNLISGSFSESFTDMENATGEFLASQSSLNIALGLIMIFTMVLAGAVKKKKDEEDEHNGRRRGQRPAIQKPDLGGSKVSKPEPEDKNGDEEDSGDELDQVIDSIGQEVSNGDVDRTIEEIADEVDEDEKETESVSEEEQVEEQKDESESSSEEFACSVCGEKFDSESGRDLHEQVMHE